jgi:hypothetical protein
MTRNSYVVDLIDSETQMKRYEDSMVPAHFEVQVIFMKNIEP